jgi:hypothetical protein
MAAKLGETRSNAYKILDRLVELGLARKLNEHKKTTYRVENPVALEAMARKNRDQALVHEKKVRDAMPTLLNYFYTFSEQPGVRFFHGVDGLHELLNDTLRVRQDVYVLRTQADDKLLSKEYFAKYIQKRAALGIKTRIYQADNAEARARTLTDDTLNKIRVWLPANSYNAPVEWDVYGDKVALISYGEEAMGILIESPQISESFRQVFNILANHSTSAQK